MKIAFIAALAFTSAVVLAADMQMPIHGISDGDTIRSAVKLPCPLCNVSVRIAGIDTPESTHLAKCSAERAKGLKAKSVVAAMAEGQTTMMVRDVKWDKYGGRINGTVEINGVDVAQALIAKGLAKPYNGSGPKPDWCS